MLMEGLTTAYKTLSDGESKKAYDTLLVRKSVEESLNPGKQAQFFLKKARECELEKNFAGCILWIHRAIECEPDSSSHRDKLGCCLSAIAEYRREALEQFEKAIELDPRNLSAYFHYGQLLELLNAPWRARPYYLRVLELDANHREAKERLSRLDTGSPRKSSRASLLRRLTGRR